MMLIFGTVDDNAESCDLSEVGEVMRDTVRPQIFDSEEESGLVEQIISVCCEFAKNLSSVKSLALLGVHFLQ